MRSKEKIYIIVGILIFCLILFYFILKINNNFNEKLKLTKINNDNLDIIDKKMENVKKVEKKKDLLKEYLDNLDLKTDNSLTKFVNNKVHYDNLAYIPENLVKVSGTYIIDSKGYIKVRQILKDNLARLAKDFYKANNVKIVVVSGYRSYKYQKGIKDRGCPDNLCAKAGYSEHQSGLAVDLFSASSLHYWNNNKRLKKYSDWLQQNAYKYGFTNTYQKGLKIDGYEIEPWHWRYVGEKLAKYLYDNSITFAEFYHTKYGDN